MDRILSDNGSNFISACFEETCKLLGTRHITISAYNPAANAVEKFNHTLMNALRVLINEHANDWNELLPYACASFN